MTSKLQEEAMQKFIALDLPKENEEPWRYTDLRILQLPELKVNGSFSINGNVEKINNADIKNYYSTLFKPKDKIDFLHASSWKDGFFIKVPKNERKEVSLSVTSSTSSHNIIILEPGASLKVFYDYKCSGLSTEVTEIFLADSASLEFVCLRASSNAHNFSKFFCDLKANTNIKWVFAVKGGKLTRVGVNTFLNGKGASSELIDMFVGAKNNHIDITTNAFHNVPETTNNMLSRGVVYDNSSSVYRGLIKIEKDSQKTSSHLHGKNLKMSKEATSNSIPSLMIDANDVQASHGDTTSKVDENQVYYLMSRGISREAAEKMIVDGFFFPLLKKVTENVRSSIESLLLGDKNGC